MVLTSVRPSPGSCVGSWETSQCCLRASVISVHLPPLSASSTVITSNKNLSESEDMFGDSVIASAILDRPLHHRRMINIKGDSYRLKEKRKAGFFDDHAMTRKMTTEELAEKDD